MSIQWNRGSFNILAKLQEDNIYSLYIIIRKFTLILPSLSTAQYSFFEASITIGGNASELLKKVILPVTLATSTHMYI